MPSRKARRNRNRSEECTFLFQIKRIVCQFVDSPFFVSLVRRHLQSPSKAKLPRDHRNTRNITSVELTSVCSIRRAVSRLWANSEQLRAGKTSAVICPFVLCLNSRENYPMCLRVFVFGSRGCVHTAADRITHKQTRAKEKLTRLENVCGKLPLFIRTAGETRKQNNDLFIVPSREFAAKKQTSIKVNDFSSLAVYRCLAVRSRSSAQIQTFIASAVR